MNMQHNNLINKTHGLFLPYHYRPGWFVRIGNKKEYEMIFIQYDKENTEKFLNALNNLFVKKK